MIREEVVYVEKRFLAGWLLIWLLCFPLAAATAADREPALLAAASAGDFERAERLLDGGASVAVSDVWGKQPLAIAASQGDIALAQLFLAHGADIDACDNWRRTPLLIAVQAGSTWLTDVLIHRGAAVNRPAANGITALLAAAQRGNAAAATLLIGAGADVNHRDVMGWTALMWAAGRGEAELVGLLLEAGAAVNAVDREGKTVLDHAIADGYPQEVVALLRAWGAAAGAAVTAAPATDEVVREYDKLYDPAIAGCVTKGDVNAPVVIVQYTDFQCLYCAAAAVSMERVLDRYRSEVRLVLKHYPLEFHSQALLAALYFEGVGRQSQAKAWLFYARLFSERHRLKEGEGFLRQAAAEAGVDMGRLDTVLASGELRERVAADIREADSFGLDGVPIFIINGRLVEGAYSAEALCGLVEQELAKSDTPRGVHKGLKP